MIGFTFTLFFLRKIFILTWLLFICFVSESFQETMFVYQDFQVGVHFEELLVCALRIVSGVIRVNLRVLRVIINNPKVNRVTINKGGI